MFHFFSRLPKINVDAEVPNGPAPQLLHFTDLHQQNFTLLPAYGPYETKQRNEADSIGVSRYSKKKPVKHIYTADLTGCSDSVREHLLKGAAGISVVGSSTPPDMRNAFVRVSSKNLGDLVEFVSHCTGVNIFTLREAMQKELRNVPIYQRGTGSDRGLR